MLSWLGSYDLIFRGACRQKISRNPLPGLLIFRAALSYLWLISFALESRGVKAHVSCITPTRHCETSPGMSEI